MITLMNLVILLKLWLAHNNQSFHNLPSEQFATSRVTDRHHPPINPPYQGFNWKHEQKLCCFRKLNSVSEFHCDFDVYRYQGWVRHSNIVVDMCCWASTCAVDVIFPLSHDATHDTPEFHIHVLLVMEISFRVNVLQNKYSKRCQRHVAMQTSYHTRREMM